MRGERRRAQAGVPGAWFLAAALVWLLVPANAQERRDRSEELRRRIREESALTLADYRREEEARAKRLDERLDAIEETLRNLREDVRALRRAVEGGSGR